MAVDADKIRSWKRRGKYAEQSFVRILKEAGYKAVRIPVSNPSMTSLPDVFASKDDEVYAFELKAHQYYAYFEPYQIKKLFDFLDMIPTSSKLKHAILAARFGKKWICKDIKAVPDSPVRICKRDHGNWEI